MSSTVALTEEIAPIRACTVCRDVQNFDLLIEDMESVLGEAWGDLSFQDAAMFLTQPDAADLERDAVRDRVAAHFTWRSLAEKIAAGYERSLRR